MFIPGRPPVTKYLIRRTLQIIPTLFFVLLTVFILMKLIPGDPAQVLLGPEASVADVARMRVRLGLDQPLPVQFVKYVERIARGDLGRSLVYRQDALSLILQRLPVTATLSLCALLFATVFGIPLGVLGATKQNTSLDVIITVVALIGLSIPIFWFGMMMIVFFSLDLGWFPAVGWGSLSNGVMEWVRHLVLPSVTLGILAIGTIVRFTRSSMLEVLRQDYVRTAVAKGLRGRLVLYRHALRNALVPVVTVIGLQLGNLLAGAVLTETVFALPGLGKLMVDAIMRRDYLLVQAEVLFIAFMYIIVNLLVDILYAFLNPRIRQSYRSV